MSDLLNQASLVMIPSGYKEDVVYSQIHTNGSGDLSFTRASNGTRVNSAGLVEVVPWNLAEQSETFDNASWVKQSSTITANTTTAPNGTTTADTLNATTAQYSGIYQSLGTLPTNVYTYSIYAKAGTNSFVYFLGQGNPSQIAIFNLSTGVITSTSNVDSASIENVGNGWYRCQIQKTGTGVEMFVGFSNIANTTPTASGTVFIWGAQFNIGSTAKPYFPTTDRLNVPRLTYQNGGGGCPSLLLEKQSTNLVTYSEQFDDAAWLTANGGGTASVSVTANYGVSPDGTQNADRIQLNKGNTGYAEIYQLFTTTISSTYTQTMWLKSLSGTPKINFGFTGSTRGTITLTTEWQRYTFTYVSGSNPNAVALTLFDGFDPTTAQSIDVLAWGCQAEESSYATSLINTTSSSATRVADACFKTGISSLIGTDFTLFYDGYETIGGQSTRYVVLKGSGGIYANAVFLEGSSNNTIALTVLNSSSAAIFTGFSPSLTNGQRVKLAVRCKNNDFAYYVNGSLVNSQASGSVPTTSDLYLGYYVDYTDNYSAVNQLAIFNTALTNAELASLTTI